MLLHKSNYNTKTKHTRSGELAFSFPGVRLEVGTLEWNLRLLAVLHLPLLFNPPLLEY